MIRLLSRFRRREPTPTRYQVVCAAYNDAFAAEKRAEARGDTRKIGEARALKAKLLPEMLRLEVRR